jgi:hypothetical protein
MPHRDRQILSCACRMQSCLEPKQVLYSAHSLKFWSHYQKPFLLQKSMVFSQLFIVDPNKKFVSIDSKKMIVLSKI